VYEPNRADESMPKHVLTLTYAKISRNVPPLVQVQPQPRPAAAVDHIADLDRNATAQEHSLTTKVNVVLIKSS
jgi:hypothetical protein